MQVARCCDFSSSAHPPSHPPSQAITLQLAIVIALRGAQPLDRFPASPPDRLSRILEARGSAREGRAHLGPSDSTYSAWRCRMTCRSLILEESLNFFGIGCFDQRQRQQDGCPTDSRCRQQTYQARANCCYERRALRPPVSFAPQCRCGSLVDFHARNIVAISGSGSSNCRPVSRGMRSAQILCFALPMASAISWRASVLSPQPIVFTHFPGSRSL
jgi:hypothetical protein